MAILDFSDFYLTLKDKYYSAIKTNEIMPFAATWMQLEIIILSEVRKRKTNILWYRLYEESKKNGTNVFI